MPTSPDILVMGAGVFGVWTAWHLRAAGLRVALVEAHAPGHSRSSSGDESRIVRCGYGPDAIYSRLAWQAMEQWRGLDAARGSQAPLLHPCGVLWLAPPGDVYTEATRQTLTREGIPLDVLDAAAAAARVPQVRVDAGAVALYEPGGGVVMARRAVATVAGRLRERGVEVVRASVVPGDAEGGRLVSVSTADGQRLHAGAFVFACGAWLPAVFPDLLAGRIRPTRQTVIYFGTPAGDDRFGPGRMPAWVDFAAGIYGVPDLEGRGVKVGLDAHGPPMDPDRDDRVADPEAVAGARAWLARRLPSLASAPVVETRVCQYENSGTGDFLIDRHPGYENVWIAGGGSGHGFKHGPSVGAYVARLVTGGGEPEPRFAIERAVTPGRSVY